MDELHQEIIALNQKVDALYGKVEQLSNQIADLLANQQHRASHNSEQSESFSSFGQETWPRQRHLDPTMTHKDVLLESNSWQQQGESDRDRNLSPDLQIRRLTAQVTAAYNRIAALEEQLLARRIHS